MVLFHVLAFCDVSALTYDIPDKSKRDLDSLQFFSHVISYFLHPMVGK
jgi:hypothetical protein